MGDTETQDLADQVIAKLRVHQAELRAAGLRTVSVFGSVARGDFEIDSDVDLVAELDPEAHISLLDLVGLQMHLADLLGRPVDLLPEPVEKQRLQRNIDRDRRLVF